MENTNWVKGCSLVVKPGVTDPITGSALGGRQGRLIDLYQKDQLGIQWDSVTLKAISPAEILKREAWGMPWSVMRLAVQDVLPTAARDLEEDVAATVAALETQYSWLSLGEQGERIRQVVNREEKHDFFTSARVWHAYLEEHLEFSFVATVIEYQRGPVKQGDEVKVVGISILDDTSGTIVRVRQKRRVYYLPLHDVRATNAPADVAQLVEDYAVWFVRYPKLFARYPL